MSKCNGQSVLKIKKNCSKPIPIKTKKKLTKYNEAAKDDGFVVGSYNPNKYKSSLEEILFSKEISNAQVKEFESDITGHDPSDQDSST